MFSTWFKDVQFYMSQGVSDINQWTRFESSIKCQSRLMIGPESHSIIGVIYKPSTSLSVVLCLISVDTFHLPSKRYL